jgi:hypothetical protein
MQRFPVGNDTEKIVYIHCFYDCIKSKYFLGMLRFYTLLREWRVVSFTEEQFEKMHSTADVEYFPEDYEKFTLAVSVFKKIMQSPRFKPAILEQLKSSLEKYGQLKDGDDSECEDTICALPEESEIVIEAKEQEIYSAFKFLKREIPADLHEKIILFGLH